MDLDPNKTIENKRFFKHGTNYLPSNVDIDKPSTDRLIANFTTKMGSEFGSKKFTQKSIESVERRKQQHILEIKKDIRRERRKQFLVSTKNYLPEKLRGFLSNLPRVTPKKVRSYIRAELSNIEQGPVSLPIYEERKKICGDCPHRKFVEGYKDPLGFCTKCGCGANPRAQLTVKLKLPATSCPLNKWGESKGIYETLWGKMKYIVKRRFNNGRIQ